MKINIHIIQYTNKISNKYSHLFEAIMKISLDKFVLHLSVPFHNKLTKSFIVISPYNAMIVYDISMQETKKSKVKKREEEKEKEKKKLSADTNVHRQTTDDDYLLFISFVCQLIDEETTKRTKKRAIVTIRANIFNCITLHQIK